MLSNSMSMDDRTKGKLLKAVRSLEKNKGKLKLFACIWKDNTKAWDIIVSADWISYDKLKENIGDIFDAFKGKFNGEFALRFSGIYPLTVNEPFVRQLTDLFEINGTLTELNDIRICDVGIEQMVLVVSRGGENKER